MASTVVVNRDAVRALGKRIDTLIDARFLETLPVLMRVRAPRSFALPCVFALAAYVSGCSATLHQPVAGDHYRGAAATATQLDNVLRDGRLVFDLTVKATRPDGSFDAVLKITDAKLIENGVHRDDEGLVGKEINVGFDAGGRLVSVSLDGIEDNEAPMVSRVIGALQATGSVSPLDLRTLRSDRPRTGTIPSIEGVNITAQLRSRGSIRSNGHETGVVDIFAEQGVDIALDATQSVKGRLKANGSSRVALDDLLLSETRIANNLEYNRDGADPSQAPVMQRSETYVRIVPPDAIADFAAFADNAGLFGCSERVSTFGAQIQASPAVSTSDTNVPTVQSDVVQYGQEAGPRIVLANDATYIVDATGVRGPSLDRDQLGQALAQALPGTEKAVVYVDADQALNVRSVIEVAATINEMQQALEVAIDARLIVGARSARLPASVNYQRLRDDAAPLETAAPLARQALLPQLMRQELARTCPAGAKAAAESFAPGTTLNNVRQAVPGLIAVCGCQGLDMPYIENWMNLFDPQALGVGWIPLPAQTSSGRPLKLGKRANLAELVGQLEAQGIGRNDYAAVRVVFAGTSDAGERDKPERGPRKRRPIQ